jgi:hypothetical protein
MRGFAASGVVAAADFFASAGVPSPEPAGFEQPSNKNTDKDAKRVREYMFKNPLGVILDASRILSTPGRGYEDPTSSSLRRAAYR